MYSPQFQNSIWQISKGSYNVKYFENVEPNWYDICREDDGAEVQCLAHSQASHTPQVQQVSLEVISE